MEMTRQDGTELLQIMGSMTEGKLDTASKREGAGIISRIADPLAPMLHPPELQGLITVMFKSQAMKIEMVFDGELRDCKAATRRVTFMTLQPVVTGANIYGEGEVNIFNSTSPSKAGTLFYLNPYNSFRTEFQHEGKMFKLVSRTVQCWKGVSVEFRENNNTLEEG